MKIEVCYALADRATRIEVEVGDRATVADALLASGIEASQGLNGGGSGFAIFGRRALPDTPLHDGDRVEILRPLTIDPKEARRLREQKRRLAVP